MKKRTLIAALCSVGLLLGCNEDTTADTTAVDSASSNRSAILPVTKTEKMDANTLMTVNDQPVSKALFGIYFQERLRGVPREKVTPEMQMAAINELASMLVIAQDAERQKLDQRPEIIAALELLRAKMLTQSAIQEYSKTHQPTDAEIQSYYDAEYAGKTILEFKARHILVKEEAQAKDLIAQLDKDGDFAALAKEHSTGPTGKDGGALGWFDGEQMVKPFSDAVKAQEVGKYSKQPVQTQFGWHVILLEETRETPAPALENVKTAIAGVLQKKSLADYMTGLREKSSLKMNESLEMKKKEAGTGS